MPSSSLSPAVPLCRSTIAPSRLATTLPKRVKLRSTIYDVMKTKAQTMRSDSTDIPSKSLAHAMLARLFALHEVQLRLAEDERAFSSGSFKTTRRAIAHAGLAQCLSSNCTTGAEHRGSADADIESSSGWCAKSNDAIDQERLHKC